MFLILKIVCFSSYAHDNAPFPVTDNIEDVIASLKELDENWFSDNQVKSKSEQIHNLHRNNSLSKKLLGINFNYKLNFAEHVEDIFQKALRKLKTLARLMPCMTSSKNVF